ncbi:MAG: efflux RND transporter periplasmic adaptor subunit [candidate division KSB1 bacterium]|jgi:HlyD family secretion protein|nr:efflux RND transporter periplasmic adaptor subunit [candidate division KSB1 bacterium]
MRYSPLFILILFCCSGPAETEISGSGVFEGTEITVSAQIPGQIIGIDSEQGNEVATGDTLARIDTEKLRIQKEQTGAALEEIDFSIKSASNVVEEARDSHNNIEKRYQRIKALYEQSSVSRQQMDDIETQYNASGSALSRARASLNAVKMKRAQLDASARLIDRQIRDGIVIAPVSGIVVDQYIEYGEFATTGSPLFSIVDLKDLWIKLYIAETDLGKVKVGDDAVITIDSFPDDRYDGKVVWISPKAEFTPKNVQTREARADLVYAVKVSVKNPKGILKIGMPADIEIEGH